MMFPPRRRGQMVLGWVAPSCLISQRSSMSKNRPTRLAMNLSRTEAHQLEMRRAYHDGAPGTLVSGLEPGRWVIELRSLRWMGISISLGSPDLQG